MVEIVKGPFTKSSLPLYKKAMTRKEKQPMSGSTISVLVWGVYLLINGVMLIVIPAQFTDSMGLVPAPDLLIRMLGLLTFILGFYYVLMARYRLTVLYPWKILGHVIGVAVMIGLYFTQAEFSLLLTAATDTLSAAWTGVTLLMERRRLTAGEMHSGQNS